MRKALIVGINDYPNSPLFGCINDANKIVQLLERHSNGVPNFSCISLKSDRNKITRASLFESIENLFKDQVDVSLFYFSGHGFLGPLGGYFVTVDCERYNMGISMDDVLALANKSPATEKIIIIDCCHAGSFGSPESLGSNPAYINEGVSILAASKRTQVSCEENDAGIFTSLIADGLSGGASDVMGKVTAASLYAYVDEALGAWDQRPIFKTNASRFLEIRKNDPVIPLEILRLISIYFESPDKKFPLDPSYEPDAEPKNLKNEKIFGHLQKFRAARLLEPVGADHMYYAAMQYLSCQLTPLGRHYYQLSKKGMI